MNYLIRFYTLTIALLLSNNVLALETDSFYMFDCKKHTQELNNIFSKASDFIKAVEEIKKLNTQDQWKSLLARKKTTEIIIEKIAIRYQIQPERVAAYLGTPAAIAWAKEYCNDKLESKKNLNDEMIAMARTSYLDDFEMQYVENILKITGNPNAVDRGDILKGNSGASALTTAASYGNVSFVRLLLDNNADIETKDPWNGATALIEAVNGNHPFLVSFLLSRGANVNAQNCCGDTALYSAVYYGKVGIVKQLLDAGANPNIRSEGYSSTLLKAQNSPFCEGVRDRIIELLKSHGAVE